MKNFVLLIVLLAIGAYAVNTTRYWDACKPSCGWDGNAAGSPNGVAKSCSINGSVLNDNAARNACESGGTAYTCMKQAPWKVDNNLSYGFAASHTNGDCGKCFELSFNNGKKMIVMISNIGGDVANGQFDLMIPGGGVGAFNALSNQISQNGGNSGNLGAQYGGFRASCATQGNVKECVRNMCNSAFSSAALADLKAGCEWYVDWFDAADNPTANSQSVTCPQALVDKYKGNFSSNPTPTPTPSSNSNGGSPSSNSNGGGSNCASVVTASTETTKIEAECYMSKNGANMVTETANGVTSIGYIENGYSTTYKVSIPSGRAGQYTMRFRIATEVQSNFSVKVNGNNVGRIDQGSTGNWNTYVDKDLSSKVQFNNGENTIVLEFGSAINVDYFLIIGSALPSSSSASVSSSSSANRPSSSSLSPSSSSSSADPVPIRQIPNAITLESLPNNATIEVYNLQGRRIYFGNSESSVGTSKILIIPVQTKGMYIVKIKSNGEIKLLRVPVM